MRALQPETHTRRKWLLNFWSEDIIEFVLNDYQEANS